VSSRLCRLSVCRGQAVGGAVEGGVVDAIWVAGSAVVDGGFKGGGGASARGGARTAGGAVANGSTGGVVDVVWAAGNAVVGGAMAGGGRASTEGRAGTVRGAVADVSLAAVGTRIALAVSREETRIGGLQAGNTLCVDVHELVVVERVSRGCCGRCRWKEERGHLFGVRLSLASRFKLRWEAVSRGQCPSQKPKRFRGGGGLY
jgi:hypothetical protein